MLCCTHNVKSLFVFGSMLTKDFKYDSDIDLLVEIDETNPLIYADTYFNLKFQLEQMFHRKIDILEQRALKNPYLMARIDQSKMRLYG